MSKIKKWVLISCIIFSLLFSYAYKALAFVEFEKGKQSQARELILKQKQEKKRLIREKYTKEQKLKKKKLIQKEKLKMTQKQPASFNKLKTFLIIGLLLLAILGVILGFLINYRRQSK